MGIETLDKAFDRIIPNKKYDVYRFLAGIFCLSKISFQVGPNEECMVSTSHPVNVAAGLLSIDNEELLNALTTRSINMPSNGEKIRYSHTS